MFQFGVNIVATFTAGAWSTMKCFIAGTIVLTATGSRLIEDIRAGDKVIATSEDNFKVKEKRVLETYIRETKELIYLTISGEILSTTYTHPFYVKGRGFVETGELQVEDYHTYHLGTNGILVHNAGDRYGGAEPPWVKDKRTPLDRETALKDKSFKPTKMRVKGAKVYQKGGKYYHRDTLHNGVKVI